MQLALLYTMAFVSFAVLIAGGVLILSLITYLIYRIWVKHSRFAKNMVNYILNRQEYENYLKWKEENNGR